MTNGVMAVDTRVAGLSISETAVLLGFSHSVCRLYTEWYKKNKKNHPVPGRCAG